MILLQEWNNGALALIAIFAAGVTAVPYLLLALLLHNLPPAKAFLGRLRATGRWALVLFHVLLFAACGFALYALTDYFY
ncbi:MAG: hypothetical protein EOO16_01415 [Chitinophagaceae bacterium]|nr:MAG: hypothetical protein EOO16_01415 [Chitinophagaceae bacterium]